MSATPRRSDNNEHLIFLSAGDIVYQADYRDMIEAKLVVPVRHFRIYVDLTPEERRSYERLVITRSCLGTSRAWRAPR